MHDQFDVTLEDQDLLREVELTTNLIIAASETDEHLTLEDADLLGEVELTTNLIIAASEADEHLTTAEIDRILGVRPASS